MPEQTRCRHGSTVSSATRRHVPSGHCCASQGYAGWRAAIVARNGSDDDAHASGRWSDHHAVPGVSEKVHTAPTGSGWQIVVLKVPVVASKAVTPGAVVTAIPREVTVAV